MKRIKILSFLSTLGLFILLSASSCRQQPVTESGEKGFSFAFLTDIHLQPELHAVEGFRQAIATVNRYHPDFVVTGGDLIRDALDETPGRADSLYNLYKQEVKGFDMPVYNTMGNHEIFGWYLSHGVTPQTPGFGKKMYEENIGKRYYTFTKKNWKFFILDGIDSLPKRYYGHIPEEEISWLTEELAHTDTLTPLVVVTHIPFITSQAQILHGGLAANTHGGVIENGKEVLDLFSHHNLKLVLQGHLHFYEDIYVRNIHFITGGAVCGAWWKGPYEGTEEGFLLVKISGDSLSTRYVDYGWEPHGVSAEK